MKSLPVSKKYPTHLIFGANTDVGKTVVSTSLVKSSLDTNQPVHYIKPLQCGGSDESFVLKHLGGRIPSQAQDHNENGAHTLFHWETPASPHLASRLENKPTSDKMVISTLQDKISSIATLTSSPSTSLDSSIRKKKIWIESAGGVLSPSSASPLNTKPQHASGINKINEAGNDSNCDWGWSTQADLYKPLHLPAILVGDGRLGGISATLSALESLIVRGYDIHGIVLIDEAEGEHGSNLPALKEYANRCLSLRSGSGRSLLRHDDSFISLPPLPPIDVPLDEWFDSAMVREQTQRLDQHLNMMWNDHVDTLYGLREEGKQSLWWPFTQHQGHDKKKVKATVIDGAAGDYFSILHNVSDDKDETDMERTAHFDACASWWTQGMGHGETSLSLAAAAAAGKFGHVIFPDVVHEPAKALADRLLFSKSGPGRDWASRVFFSDDGSTAMEVAIKMGMKKFMYDREAIGKEDLEGAKLTVCAQKDCYHGDTLGVMDVAEPSIFNEGQHPWYEPKGLFLSYPTVRYVNGTIGVSPLAGSGCPADAATFNDIDAVLDMDERLSSDLYTHYCEQIEKEWDIYEKEANRYV
jgi:dethiobiotin synthetase/adenosylmethionine--8-amino-7-oxononanoate aminotransferase